jgi:hypothetical protein
MAHKEQRKNREKRKPKQDKDKGSDGAQRSGSTFSSQQQPQRVATAQPPQNKPER